MKPKACEEYQIYDNRKGLCVAIEIIDNPGVVEELFSVNLIQYGFVPVFVAINKKSYDTS